MTTLATLRSRLRDRLGLSKLSELELTATIWPGDNTTLSLPLSGAEDAESLPTTWDKADVVEAILERARLLYTGYRGGASQVDAALGQFFDKEAKQHDSAPHTFDK
jgi:hypothetical protein